jgi:hypothetical protein
MKLKWMLAVAVVALLLHFSPTAQAFECPKHIAMADTAIGKTTELMKDMEGKMPSTDIRFVRGVLDDARIFLEGAKHKHNTALGYSFHMRSIIWAHQALGHAIAAYAVHDAFMKEMEKRG